MAQSNMAIKPLTFASFDRLGFWQLAAEIPEQFLEYAANDETWVVSSTQIDKPHDDFVGPFKFPIADHVLILFANSDKIETSQDKFVAFYKHFAPTQGFPYASQIALIYPVGSMLNFSNAPVLIVLGYGFANLGYLLAVALIPGTFRILGLKYRIQVFIASVLFWLIGFRLTNVAI